MTDMTAPAPEGKDVLALVRALRDEAYRDGQNVYPDVPFHADAAESALLAHVENLRAQADRVRVLEQRLRTVTVYSSGGHALDYDAWSSLLEQLGARAARVAALEAQLGKASDFHATKAAEFAERIRKLEQERDYATESLGAALNHNAGHPSMCCGKCRTAIAESEAERDAAITAKEKAERERDAVCQFVSDHDPDLHDRISNELRRAALRGGAALAERREKGEERNG